MRKKQNLFVFKKAALFLSAAILAGSLAACRGASVPVMTDSAPEQSSSRQESSSSQEASSQDAPSREESSSAASSENSAVSSSGETSSAAASSQKAVSQPSSSHAAVSIDETPVPSNAKPILTKVLVPEAPGTTQYEGGNVTLDASNAAKGYVMVKYSGGNSKIKIRISKDGGTVYTYNINARESYEVFPLTDGSGSYTVAVFENVSGTSYSQAFGQVIDVTLENSFLPFLYPNQYVNFSDSSAAVKKGAELAAKAADEKGIVTGIYDYVVKNISYDYKKASSVKSGYLPDVDSTLSTKKGICFDYAALMTAMLRAQNIPTKLVVGYTGKQYHAWISVYLEEVGWVDNAIYFDGKSWKLMDPTFASSGKSSDSIKQYISNEANYQAKYTY